MACSGRPSKQESHKKQSGLVDTGDGVDGVHLVSIERVLVGFAVVNPDVIAVNVSQGVLHPVDVIAVRVIFVGVRTAGLVPSFGTPGDKATTTKKRKVATKCEKRPKSR